MRGDRGGAQAVRYPVRWASWASRSSWKPELHLGTVLLSVGIRQPAGKHLRATCYRGGKKAPCPKGYPGHPAFRQASPTCLGPSGGPAFTTWWECVCLYVCNSVPEVASGPR